jgi:nucleotide-binding universal stress UspA family protein
VLQIHQASRIKNCARRCDVDKSEQEIRIRRILVALDASTHSLAALEAAADLAANLHAELIGLFVEDENLLHLAGLPFAQELSAPSATSRPMSSKKMEHQLRLQASQARRALKMAADRVEAQWSFQTVRGQVTASVLSAALEADLLAMGRVSRPLSGRSRLGSTARAVSTGTRRSVLLIQHGSDLNYPVLVTYDGTRAARQALETAVRLAQASSDDLNVLMLAETREDANKLKEELSPQLEQRGLTAEFHWLPQASVDNLVTMVQGSENCVLVLGGENPLLKAKAIQSLLDRTDCPVLLVR